MQLRRMTECVQLTHGTSLMSDNNRSLSQKGDAAVTTKKKPDDETPKKKKGKRNPDSFPEEERLPSTDGLHVRRYKLSMTGRTALRFPEDIVRRMLRQCEKQVLTTSQYIRAAVVAKILQDEYREQIPPMPPPGGW